jgi:hypothetical protein
MTQRAYVGISESALQNNGPLPDGSQVIGVTLSVRYMDFEGGPPNQNGSFILNVPSDASPREILNVCVALAIEDQPAGFHLTERDVIISGLERG